MIFDKVRQIISDQTGRDIEKITEDTSFTKDLDADSIDLFQLINDFEYEFNIQIDNSERIKTVGDMVRIIKENS